MESTSSHVTFINPAFYRRPQQDSFPSHHLTPRPTPAPAAKTSAALLWPTHRTEGRRKGLGCLTTRPRAPCVFSAAGKPATAQPGQRLRSVYSAAGMGSGGKAMKGEVFRRLLQETEICLRFCFALLLLFPNSSWSKEKEKLVCQAVSLLVRCLCKGHRYCPKGVSSLPSCLCTQKHGNALQRAARPA